MQTEALLKHPKDDHISKSDDAIEEVHTSYVLKKIIIKKHLNLNLTLQLLHVDLENTYRCDKSFILVFFCKSC